MKADNPIYTIPTSTFLPTFSTISIPAGLTTEEFEKAFDEGIEVDYFANEQNSDKYITVKVSAWVGAEQKEVELIPCVELGPLLNLSEAE